MPFSWAALRPSATCRAYSSALRTGIGPSSSMFAQTLAFQQLTNEVRNTIVCAGIEYRENVGMVHGCDGTRFLLKPPHAIGVPRKRLRQDFDRDIACKPRIVCPIHFS